MTAETDSTVARVVIVHGLYMHALAMIPLARHLRACGLECLTFSYASMRRCVSENAALLESFLQSVDAPVVHFVCHSLGGFVVRDMLHRGRWARPGRVLALGTPHLGCHVAKRLGAHRATAWTVGRSLDHGLDGDMPPWPPDREVATIAGDRPYGLGRVVPGLPRPNDGVVAVEETRLGPEFPHLVLHVNHSGMLLSRRVAEHACAYLKTGDLGDAGGV